MAKTFDDKKIIYTMDRVTRAYGTKVVLKDVSISYYYGAKIGVIGANGSGKSSLFKILAGVDKDFSGETKLAPGYTIGYLEQEPQLTPGKTVIETVKEGVKEITALLEEFDKINEAFGDPDADIDKMSAESYDVVTYSPTKRIYEAVQKVPKGCVATYGQIAELAGNKRMARAVGNALHKNPDPEHIPCYRIVNSKGELAEAFVFGGEDIQAKLLMADGIEVKNGRVDLKRYGICVADFLDAEEEY